MSRPPYRPTPDPAQGPQPKRSRGRRAARMTVGVTLLLAVATGVTVGAAAYSKNSATNSAAVSPTSAQSAADVRDTDVASTNQEARDLAEMGQSREVIPGVSVKIGELRTYTDPSGLRATTLPLSVINTGALTRSVDITIVAISDKGEVITTDIGTAANLRPGQLAEVQVLELVDNAMAEQLAGATFRIEEAYAY